MRNLKKKGFTIIELCIVLSIIGILSVVLVPKIGASKFEAKNKVVLDNVDIVRDYVAKVLKSQGLVQNDVLKAQMNGEFNSSAGDKVENPFTSGTGIYYAGPYGKDSNTSVSIVYRTGISLKNIVNMTFNKSDTGIVVVECYDDGYFIQGIDGNGNVVRKYTIRNNYGTAHYYVPPSPVDIALSQSVDEVYEFLEEFFQNPDNGGIRNNQLALALEAHFSGANAIVNPVTNETGVDYVPNLNKDTSGLALVVDNNDQYSITNPNATEEFKQKFDLYTNPDYRGMVVVISTKNGYIIGGINENPEVIENIRVFLNGN